ncbi:CocE/NonD family hydrolase [uncultured Spirosoma sp.]|uniref:CocE/NonD family hydrolase n=1 Tax=uncultured Spirosoma sp. TaxID=278208 RepID=UPI00258FAE8F|nr:CocE/NonD family hydrolase [uncultured Spirosoma sp.]
MRQRTAVRRNTVNRILKTVYLLLLTSFCYAQTPGTDSLFVRQNYRKLDRQISMRDGVKLYTTIYVPTDASPTNRYPILMERTPYSAAPYGETNYPKSGPGMSTELSQEKYIFVYQDVRGRYKSEGQFEEMTPALNRSTTPAPTAKKGKAKSVTPTGTDESTDTYDTIDWLLKNVPNNNGRVGLMGISYPGFYASAALPGAHPALKAVSPQAPVTDEFIGDDARHKGAFFLLDNFGFINYFDGPRTGPVEDYDPLFKAPMKDAYSFFLKMGALKNANGPTYYNQKSKIWNEYIQHDTYDAYWQSRNIRPHLKNLTPATLVVGGWFDAEDLFGALATYKSIEQQSKSQNKLVMGPWTHGAWARANWSQFGPLAFGQNTARYYRDSIETRFFAYHLKNKGTFDQPQARVFDTGTNRWQSFTQWPPAAAQPGTFYLTANQQLSPVKPTGPDAYDAYVSDPAKPVPYTDGVFARRNNQYMIEDQRFAARRPDVLVFETEPLTEELTSAGPIDATLFVATSGTDADFIVKVIDVLPDSTASPDYNKVGSPLKGVQLAGYQRLVRADVIRGRFRSSFEKPEAFVPNQPTVVKVQLPDVLHTFRKGHRLMVQIQSSWFPLVDRNPQQFINIGLANNEDYKKATIRLYHDADHPSAIQLLRLNP